MINIVCYKRAVLTQPSLFTVPPRPLPLLLAELGVLLACAALCLNLSTTQFALLGSALALAVLAWQERTGVRAAIRHTQPVLLGGVGLWVAVGVSLLASPVGWDGLAWFQRCRAWLVLLPLALTFYLGGPALRRRAVWALLGGAVVAALIGVVQHFTGIHPGAALLGVAPEQWQIRAPSDPDRFAAVGLFYNRTRFAHVLVVALSLAIGLALWGRRPQARTLATCVTVVVLSALVLSYTRAALGALLLGFGLLLLIAGNKLPRRLRWGALAGVVVLACFILAVPSLRQRASSAVNLIANNDRQFIWRRGFEMAADFGATGIGFAHYGLAHAYYYDRMDSTFGMRSQGHNLYLTFLVEMGPLGLLALLAFWAAVLRCGRSSDEDTATEISEDLALRRGALLAVISLALISFFHDPLYQAVEAIAFFVPPALLGALPRAKSS